METLKKIVTNQYFPAAAVLTAVLLFWIIALFGGLSLLNNNQPPMATLTWMLFVYAAAVLTPLAGILAGVDLVRRWRRNRMYALVELEQDWNAEYEAVQDEMVQDKAVQDAEPADVHVQEPATQAEAPAQPAEPVKPAEPAQPVVAEAPRQSAPKQPAQHHPVTQQQPVKRHPVQQQPGKKQSVQPKQRKKAA